jgi:hypothetical protein
MVDAISKTAAPEPLNQLAVIKGGRWKSAVFTTFTFNTGFFESYVLPRLHEAGCEEVTVLVDELFYLSSLAENPRHAGTAYRVLPVALANGVFHAKLTYLRGANGNDVCMVGSGNLTWPGYGHQLECLDVLDPARHAQAFRDLAAILRGLLLRADFRPGDAASVLEELCSRAAAVADTGGGDDSTRLLAPITESVSEQVVGLLAGGKFRELLVVSPFHAPDAGPCRRLAAALRIPKVRIAVDSATGNTPLKESIPKLEFVEFEDSENRATHAKWYEFRGPVNWLLSGSVNATQTSLETAANFEVSTLRRGVTRLPRWKESTPQKYSAGAFEFAEAADDEHAISATLRGRRLVGTFLWPDGVDGNWRAELSQGGIRVNLGKTSVVKGAFELEVPKGIESEPCQLRLRHAERIAMAWVMFEAELRMSTAEREFARKIRRLGSPEAAPDDFVAVLGWLAERIANVGTTGTGIRRPNATPDQDSEPRGVFDYEQWSAGAGSGVRSNHSLLGECRSALVALSQYAKNVADGHGVNRESGEGEFNGDSDGDVEDTPSNGASEQRVVDALGTLEKALKRTLERGVDEVESATFVLEAFLWTLVLEDRENRRVALDSVPFVQWTSLAAPYIARHSTHGPLAELTLASCACGFSMTAGADARRERFAALARRVVTGLKDSQPAALIEAQLRDRPCFSMLSEEEKGRAAQSGDAMLSHEGFGEKLSAYLESVPRGARFGPPPTELVSQTGGLLSMLANKTVVQQPIAHWKSSLPARCSERCYHQFDSSDMSVLRNRRSLRCIGCGTLHFWTGAAS